MQLYVIIMVRSKILILEHKEILHEIQVYNIVEPREFVGNLDTSTWCTYILTTKHINIKQNIKNIKHNDLNL